MVCRFKLVYNININFVALNVHTFIAKCIYMLLNKQRHEIYREAVKARFTYQDMKNIFPVFF